MRILMYDSSVPVKGKDIYGAREGVPNCRFAADAMAVSSLDDMIQKLTAKRQQTGQLVSVLTCSGHAAPGSMAVAGIIDAKTNMQRENYDPRYDLEYRQNDVAGPFPQLQQLLAPNAFFFLAGCEVANEQKGQNLLLTISRKLPGVWVVGVREDVSIVDNKDDNRVEVHYSINQQDNGLIEPMCLMVARNGQIEENEDNWPTHLIDQIALWPR